MENYRIFNSIKRNDLICLISHSDPDADALCSLVVLKRFLKSTLRIKNVEIFADCESLPDIYIPIVKRANLNPTSQGKYDVAISLDCPNSSRLGKYKTLFDNAAATITIDHHATNNKFGNFNLVEMASSTCEIIFKILEAYNHKFSKQDLGMLYAGIITDTGNFTVGNLKRSAYEVAAKCAERVDPRLIYKQFMNNNTLKNMQLLSLAINNITTHMDDRIIITHITPNDALRYLAKEEDYLGIVNRIAAISDCDLTALIYPKGNRFYVSMRAREGYSVSDIAKKNGGGGHNGAAAFESDLPVSEIENMLTSDFKKILENSVQTPNFHF